MRTYNVKAAGVFTTQVMEAPSSESAALRFCQDRKVPRPRRVDVAMLSNGRFVPVAVYRWDGRDVTLMGRS